jgi:hypothetical protein
VSKTAKKSRSELEELRGENRKLRSENKKLLREIKNLSKRSHFYEEVIDDVTTDIELKDACDNCGKGDLISMDLGLIKLIRCNLCDFEKKVKKGINE